MAEQAKVEETIAHEQRNDCGCGCGGAVCGTERQEVVFVTSLPDRETNKPNSEQCDCGCECCA